MRTCYMPFGHIEGCYYQLAATVQLPIKYNVFSHLTAW